MLTPPIRCRSVRRALQAVFTPEELYPLTGVRSLVLNTSVEEGLTILHDAIMVELATTGNAVTVFGWSQSAIIASLEMQRFTAMGGAAPSASDLNFVLVGNEMNPNGGMLARFPDLTLPTLDLTFYGATPSDTIYPTAIYTLEYDGFADFSRYPLNFISDLNAVAGITFVHTKYLDLTPAQVEGATKLPTSPGYTGVTDYYIIRTENRPLLQPLRAVPVIGDPLADLIQPNLKVIVNLGYGDPNYGYSTSYADVRTPFGLWPNVPPQVIADALAAGTQEGILDFTADLQALSAQPLTLPQIQLPQPADLVMGGTGSPIPTPSYVNAITTLFIDPVVSNPVVKALVTPEELYPITGVKSLPFQTSVQLGLQILDGAIWEQINAGNHVTVFGYSQSAVIASLEMQHLISLGPNAPSPSQLNFILIGNEMNPNGGILARIPGLNVTTLGLPFYGATPDNPYPTTTYTLEYDGFADFPRYPLNVLSDINAVFGILTVHTTYADLTPAQIASATQLPTQGTTSNTYYIIETEHLPLLAPLRAIPVIGPPLAALVEPNLEVIVNLGYGDPRFGYSTSPANVPTPFGLFPDVPASVVADALVAGTQQGVNDFMVELPAALNTLPQTPMPAFPPYVPTLLPPPPPPQPATLINIADTFASVVSTGYSILLPTADLGLAFVTILPAYDLTLFVNQLAAGNLRAAIELPLAATIGLAALGGMIEFIAIVVTLADITQQLQSFSI